MQRNEIIQLFYFSVTDFLNIGFQRSIAMTVSIKKVPICRLSRIILLEVRGVLQVEHQIPCLTRILPLINLRTYVTDKKPQIFFSHRSKNLLIKDRTNVQLSNRYFCRQQILADASNMIRHTLLLTNLYSGKANEESRRDNAIIENRKTEENKEVSTSVVENIKETTKTISYTGIIIVVFCIAMTIVYAILSELFSSKSPHRIYSRAYKYISEDPKVRNLIGDQIKGFGEETRRGRRQHVSHIEYSKNGRNYLRMKFYIKGNRGYGTVHLEMVENDDGKYEYRYLFVVIDSDPSVYKKTLILEDNRSKYDQGNDSTLPEINNHENLKEIDLSLK